MEQAAHSCFSVCQKDSSANTLSFRVEKNCCLIRFNPIESIHGRKNLKALAIIQITVLAPILVQNNLTGTLFWGRSMCLILFSLKKMILKLMLILMTNQKSRIAKKISSKLFHIYTKIAQAGKFLVQFSNGSVKTSAMCSKKQLLYLKQT